MLVLSATYVSWLGYMVPKEELRRLLTRTIAFLRRLEPISKTCARDAQILQAIHAVIFPPPAELYRGEIEPMPRSADVSFSSRD